MPSREFTRDSSSATPAFYRGRTPGCVIWVASPTVASTESIRMMMAVMLSSPPWRFASVIRSSTCSRSSDLPPGAPPAEGLRASPSGRPRRAGTGPAVSRCRSEEHTSELQSHVNLVCRLLLEKKKNIAPGYHDYKKLIIRHDLC